MSEIVSFRVDFRDQLREYAERTGQPVSEVIRRAVETTINRPYVNVPDRVACSAYGGMDLHGPSNCTHWQWLLNGTSVAPPTQPRRVARWMRRHRNDGRM